MTEERRTQPERRVQGLTKEMARLNFNLTELANRVEVANALNIRQTKITKVVRGLVAMTIALVIATGVVLAVAVQVAHSSARTQCQALNAANATNSRFWDNLIVKFPAVPPGADATQSERDAFARSQVDLARFKLEIARLGTEQKCP